MLSVISITTLLGLNVSSRWAEEMADFNLWEMPNVIESEFQSKGINGLRKFIADPTNFPLGLTVYVTDDSGQDILDRDIESGRFSFGGRKMGQGPPPFPFRPEFSLVSDDGLKYRAFFGRSEPQALGPVAAPGMRQIVLPVALMVSALACFILTKYLSQPLAQMVGAARGLALGDLSKRVGLSRADEIGDLATQFDAMAERIQRTENTRQELFRNLSHELRTPLARIQLAVELAGREPVDRQKHLDRITRETDLLEKMTQQMLQLARIQATDHMSEGTIDVVEVLSLVVDDARYESRAKQIQIEWVSPTTPLFLAGDIDLFRSAIENVVRNAIQYSPDDSHIRIDFQTIGSELFLRFADEGPGVPDDKLRQIFEPFARANNEQQGIGVGLAITQGVIGMMGGSVACRNRHPHGFEVRIRVPCWQNPQQ